MNNLLADVSIGESLTLQGGETIGNVGAFQSVGALLSSWLPNIYIISGLILFFLVLLGGFTMITNAGNQEKLAQGQKVLTSAIIGFVILFGSYWIIQIIQVLTGVPILGSGL